MEIQEDANSVKEEEAKKEDDIVDVATRELATALPKTTLPLFLKLIALFTLIGGLSIIEGSFSGIFTRSDIDFFEYILRLAGGLSLIAISYGLVMRRDWAIWLYFFIVVAGLFINPAFLIFPAVIVAYLFYERKIFKPSILDKYVSQAGYKLKEVFRSGKEKISKLIRRDEFGN